MCERLTYQDVGVNRDRGRAFVEQIGRLLAPHRDPRVLSGPGGFSGLFALPTGYREPVLVSGADGVGTKLRIASQLGRHDTIGWDLVAMCVNDVVVSGARPLFFLDYLATATLELEQGGAVLQGIVDACASCGVALLGGETAEMPGFYGEGEYDLAGFAVGIVERSRIPCPSSVRPGDLLLGLPSTGLHSNGYSLARRLFLERMGLPLESPFPGTSRSTGEVLLEPTQLYVEPALACYEQGLVKTMVHVTGGGLLENLPRSLPQNLCAEVLLGSWPELPVYQAMDAQVVELQELYRTFNMGIGYVFIASPSQQGPLEALLRSMGEMVYTIGRVVPREEGGAQAQLVVS